MNTRQIAQCITHAAGLTRQSACTRHYIGRFRTGGARLFKNEGQSREERRGQDYDAQWTPDQREYGADVTIPLDGTNGQE